MQTFFQSTSAWKKVSKINNKFAWKCRSLTPANKCTECVVEEQWCLSGLPGDGVWTAEDVWVEADVGPATPETAAAKTADGAKGVKGSCGGEGVDDGDDDEDDDGVVENICNGCLLLLMVVAVRVVVEGRVKLLMSFEAIACGEDGDKLPPRLEVSSWYSIWNIKSQTIFTFEAFTRILTRRVPLVYVDSR